MSAWISPKTHQPISADYQRRLARAGITKGSFESGAAAKSGKVSAARSHAKTPEHGLRDAAKRPEKYRDYLEKRQTGRQLPPADMEALRDDAWHNVNVQIGEYHKFNAHNVFLRIYGDPDDTRFPGMTVRELRLAGQASEQELRQLGKSYKSYDNPFWYH